MNRRRLNGGTGQGPSGFTPHSGGRASQYARQQGWGINEAERRETAKQKQDSDGGTDYDYGARDFGDIPLSTVRTTIKTANKAAVQATSKATNETANRTASQDTGNTTKKAACAVKPAASGAAAPKARTKPHREAA